ncbi:hypothetical protein Q4E93_00505 [Flavitalea sp. BT771]|uniref:hypothetical protein n=1 Tax=Flavitalea sp. BT771 TaxID=3063329 RepID=UPI0026E44BC6|nr:hypothetical protein [Flavitalea sp. BT771]MDO6429044.1 hypothetical protein [Flavitalea sp. BT771]MDV6218828.1 hypothetical protein [Flavitalea sp. BT771]
MQRRIQQGTSVQHYLPAMAQLTESKIGRVNKRTDMKMEAKTEVAENLTEKLNLLAKSRMFSRLHRVKKYDPL